MQMIELVCPKCGANLTVNAELNQAYCNYCGTGIYIDKSKDYVSMRMADAEYKRAEAEQMRVMHEIELSNIAQNKEKKKKIIIASFIIAGVLMFVFSVYCFAFGNYALMDIGVVCGVISIFYGFLAVAYGILSGVIKITLK